MCPDGERGVGWECAAGGDAIMSRRAAIFDGENASGVRGKTPTGQAIDFSWTHLGKGRINEGKF